MYRKRKVTLVQFFLALLFVISMFNSSNVIIPVNAQVHFDVFWFDGFQPDHWFIIVSKTSGGNATYHTHVSLTIPPAKKGIPLNLSTTCSQGYSIKVVPESLFVKANQNIEINVELTVPAQAPAINNGKVTLFGEITLPDNSTVTDNITGTFSILDYNHMNVSLGPEITNGIRRNFAITFRNDGNVNDSYHVLIIEPINGLNVTRDKAITRILKPNETDDINVSVRCSLDLVRYDYRKDGWKIMLVVWATSFGERPDFLNYQLTDHFQKNITVTAHFEPVRGIDFQALNASLALVLTLIVVIVVKVIGPKRRRS